MYIYILKPLEIRKEKEELTFKSQESMNCPNHQEAEPRHIESTTYDGIKCDVTVASSGSDVTIRDILWNADVNRLIARKRHVPRKCSLMYSVGGFGRSLMAYSRTITFVALLLAIVINVTEGLVNIRPSEGKSIVGNLPSLPLSGQIYLLVCPASLFLYILRDLAAFILGINEGFCHYMTIKALGDNNKRLKRRREVLHNTRIRNKGGYLLGRSIDKQISANQHAHFRFCTLEYTYFKGGKSFFEKYLEHPLFMSSKFQFF